MKTFIIGYGRMGQRHHIACKNLQLDVIRIYDVAEQTRTDGTRISACDQLVNDLDTLKPQLVIIASTAASHFDYLKLCLENGIPFVLCEKPLCTSLEQLEVIQQIAQQKTQTKIAVNHQMRFMDNYTQIKDLLETGNLGKITSISVQSGNFGAAMNSTHYFEMFSFLTNEFAQNVWAWLIPQSDPNPRGKQYQDHAGCIRIVSPSGKRLYMDFSEDQGHGLWITYTCSMGQIHVDELAGKVSLCYRKNIADQLLPTTRYGLEANNETFFIKPSDTVEPTQRVIESLLKNQDYPNLQDGLMTVKTLICAHASSDHQHQMMDIDSLPQEYYKKVFPWA